LSFSTQFLNGLGAFVEHIEYPEPDSGFDNQRRRKAEGELHDAFRRDLRGGHGCHVGAACSGLFGGGQ
jgi:hypothetical protein